MQGRLVKYDGRMVAMDGFRVFMYGKDNRKKVVNSWDEFQEHISSGIWFESIHDVPVSVDVFDDGSEPNDALSRLMKSGKKRK